MGAASYPIDRETVAARVAGFPRLTADRADLKQAAVAVCVIERDGLPRLLLTRRAAGLRAHAGQWALPGGRRDDGETATDGALRELAEEVGLELGPDAVLGQLDDYVSRSGYVITPVVCWGGPTGELTGSEAEVASLHEVPVADLDVEPRLVSIPESDAPVIQIPLLGGYLHAPTAAIVHQFCRIACRGEVHRVAHYEQPVFAWRLARVPDQEKGRERRGNADRGVSPPPARVVVTGTVPANTRRADMAGFHGIAWFEIGTDDPAATEKFYGDVFGWTVGAVDDDGYRMVTAGDGPGLHAGGVLETGGEVPGYAVFGVLVADVDEACQRVKAAGGSVRRAPQVTAGGITFAHLLDPAGNQFEVFTMPPGRG